LQVSPDGRHLSYEVNGDLIVAAIQTPERAIATLEGHDEVWSPDGRELAFYGKSDGQSQLQLLDLATGNVKTLTHFKSGVSPGVRLAGPGTVAFSWAPDSTQIAFTSRLMDGYEQLGKPEDPPIRQLFSTDYSRFPALAGLMSKPDFWATFTSSEDEAARYRAAERKPELNSNHLFIANTKTGEIGEVETEGEIYAPAWSPDGKTIAALRVTRPAKMDYFVGDFFGGNLVLINRTGFKYTEYANGYKFSGPPHWSPNSTAILMSGQDLLKGFVHLLAFDVVSRRWRDYSLPGGGSVYPFDDNTFKWSPNGKEFVIKIRNRFVNRLWRINAGTGKADLINTADVVVTDFAQASDGEIYYLADGPSFRGRLYATSGGTPKLLMDANPQIRSMELGKQFRITWRDSSWDEVDGIVLLPPTYKTGYRYPLIVEVYPGKGQDSFWLQNSYQSQRMSQLQAVHGYIVFIPELRAPHAMYNFPRDEAYSEKARGGAGFSLMVDDVNTGVHFLVDQGFADPSRVTVSGHSNGGFSANFVITESDVARCAIISAGFNNWFSKPAGLDIVGDGGPNSQMLETDIYHDLKTIERWSPILRMDHVNASVLMFSGDRDWEMSLQAASEFSTLRSLGKDVEWRRYRDEEHAFVEPGNIQDALDYIFSYLDRKCGGATPVPAAPH
jgi:dipeptidyl aminopeptidase/acylaminoacyl peptidase